MAFIQELDKDSRTKDGSNYAAASAEGCQMIHGKHTPSQRKRIEKLVKDLKIFPGIVSLQTLASTFLSAELNKIPSLLEPWALYSPSKPKPTSTLVLHQTNAPQHHICVSIQYTGTSHVHTSADRWKTLEAKLDGAKRTIAFEQAQRGIVLDQLSQERLCNETLQMEKDVQAEQILSMKMEIDALRKICSTLIQERQEPGSESSRSLFGLSFLRKKLSSTDSKLRSTRRRKEVLDMKLQNAVFDNAHIRSQLSSTEDWAWIQQNMKYESQQKTKILQDSDTALRESFASMLCLHTSTQEELEKVKSELLSTLNDRDRLRSSYDEVEETLKTVRDELETSKKKIQVFKSHVKTSFTALQNSKSTIADLTEEKGALSKKIEKLKGRNMILTEQTTLLKDKTNDLKGLVRNILRELTEADIKAAQKESEIRSLEQANEDQRRHYTALETRFNTLQSDRGSCNFIHIFQLEARQDLALNSIRRGKYIKSTSPSPYILNEVQALNEAITKYSYRLNLLKKWFKVLSSDECLARARTVIGDKLTSRLEGVAVSCLIPAGLITSVIRSFLVVWCRSIIDALYPKRQNFSDLLIELTSKRQSESGSSTTSFNEIPGKAAIIPITNGSNSPEWVEQVHSDLSDILQLGGIRIPPIDLKQALMKIVQALHIIFGLPLLKETSTEVSRYTTLHLAASSKQNTWMKL